jgi:indole-3-glycerol phosphate synthase
MTILDTIVAQKKLEVRDAKQRYSWSKLERMAAMQAPVKSLRQRLSMPDTLGIIAEFKRKSPSKGWIHEHADLPMITQAYAQYGASAISVLTDPHFFGGSLDDLVTIRPLDLPILRKEFIIDPFQVLEARAHGADIILLIAACLSPAEVDSLAALAAGLGMEVILELHDMDEVNHISPNTPLIGINNRNLKTFQVDIENSLRMAEVIPADKIKIAESGMHAVEDILTFRRYGFQGFLIGELFMKAPDPTIAFATFMQELNHRICV